MQPRHAALPAVASDSDHPYSLAGFRLDRARETGYNRLRPPTDRSPSSASVRLDKPTEALARAKKEAFCW